jgi:hypothetical protein
MDHSRGKITECELDPPRAPDVVSTAAAGERYRRPRVVAIGTATEVVQQNSTGKQSDGSGGWYVWGS